ncbi:hypothetical protein Selsp_2038 [Selenomonas sputigena ATCC 35185]|uniref:Uncharacterized protein n=1 Tax=Selenomonas sputigena (strain ATCC 35185 / DSM 20758 / CCUG 44933 / VPI D19B-28) TaxID=546271 RepID=C9LYP0_SELS3|nr:hypothetical protein Selsp_2038 [Selenomonas sputigena ATCC 35185]EEX75990.1 hypothetical protein SELSPUOL_02601 [Selenomonas sputigena ATCC 35185]
MLLRTMLYFMRCRLQTGTGRRVSVMLGTFILSILAGVIANHISKWLDERENDGDEPRE